MSCVKIEKLPPLLQEIVKAVGLDGAMALAEAHGGNRIYVPRGRWRTRSEDVLRQSLSDQQITDLIGSFGGEFLAIPSAKRWVGIHLFEKGIKNSEIARRLKVGERSVRRWISATPADVRASRALLGSLRPNLDDTAVPTAPSRPCTETSS